MNNQITNRVENGLLKAKRYLPEPSFSINSKSLINGAINAASSFASSVSPILGSGINSVGLDPSYRSLIEQQIEVQVQMQTTSMQSNIERSKHEAMMTPIRNTRVA